MAGKRHHHLPQFLQKGFSFEPGTNNGHMVWFFEYQNKPQKRNTKRIGSENYFYGKIGKEIEVDTKITKSELEEFSQTVSNLRTTSKLEAIDCLTVSRLVTHLGIRVHYLRKLMQVMWDSFSTFFPKILENEDLTKALIMQKLLQELNQRLAVSPTAIPPKEIDEAILEVQNTLNQLPSSFFKEKSKEISLMLEAAKPKVLNAIKEGHIKALIKSIAPEKRVKLIQNFNWEVRVTKTPLILGDIGPFVVDKKRVAQPYLLPGEDIEEVFLPISTQRVLIGCRNGKTELNAHEINQKSARLSANWFIAQSPEPKYESLSNEIGHDYVNLVEDLLVQTLMGIFEEN